MNIMTWQWQDAPSAMDDAALATAKDVCPVCGGDGFLISDDDAEQQCDACDGTGQKQPGSRAA
jgi:DnaJ-class molecular chaperone